MLSSLADLVLNALASFAGLAPERPLWLRRLAQLVWLLLGALVVVAALYGLAALARS